MEREKLTAEQELEILRKYQNSGAVIGIQKQIAMAETIANKMVNDLTKLLFQISKKAQIKAGILTNENGQLDFADTCFFDVTLSDEQKIFWLEQFGDTQKERIEVLKKSQGI